MIFPGMHMPMRTKPERARRDAAFREWVAAERLRIRRQRRFLTKGRGPGVETMIQAMLDRAWALLDSGETEAADALLEFVPEPRAQALLDEFFETQVAECA